MNGNSDSGTVMARVDAMPDASPNAAPTASPHFAASAASSHFAASAASPNLASLGGWRALFANPGLILHTLRQGGSVGQDGEGNRYFEERRSSLASGRKRRWVVYAGRRRDASLVPPEWHAWLHFTTDAPLTDQGRRPWQKPYLPNLTGSPRAYRPSGHDYSGGIRVRASADYEAWTPDA